MISEDVIKGIARPFIGFFVGMVLAYTFQLAQGAGWVFAIGWLVFLGVLFGAVLVFDDVLQGLGNRIFGGPGIKPARKRAGQPKAHWIVRYGWIIGTGIGFAAVFILPESTLDLILRWNT